MAPDRFLGPNRVALDVVARRPDGSGKFVVEHDPERIPIRFLRVGSLVVMSGVTTVLPTLAEQVAADLERVSSMLVETGLEWGDVVDCACYLHSGQDPYELRRQMSADFSAARRALEVTTVDGYSAPGKLVEIEVTALGR